MAARTRRISIDANTRAKIQTTQLINRLTKHALGEIELTSTQVKAAQILLDRTMPTLQSQTIDMNADVKQTTVVSEEPISAEEWQSKYASSGLPSKDRKPH